MKTRKKFKKGLTVFWFDPNLDDVKEGTIIDIGEDGFRITVRETDTGTVYGVWARDLID